MCQKIPYSSRADAMDHVKYMASQKIRYSRKQSKARKSGRKLRPYACRFCGFWHLTTLKQK